MPIEELLENAKTVVETVSAQKPAGSGEADWFYIASLLHNIASSLHNIASLLHNILHHYCIIFKAAD